MKGAFWATLMVCSIAGVAAVALSARHGTFLVSPPPALAATAQARCPDYTLEDDGVCLPISHNRATRSAPESRPRWVPASSELSAFYVASADAPVPPGLGELPEAVLLTRTRVGSPVTSALAEPGASVTRIEQLGQTWVITLGGDTPKGGRAEVVISGLRAVEPNLQVGSPGAAGTPLGTSGDVLVIWTKPP